MKKQKIILSLVCLLFLCVCPVLFTYTTGEAISETISQPKKFVSYDILPDTVMPILGYTAMPNANAGGGVNPSFITRTNFLNYKNAGFNIVSGLYEREPFSPPDVVKALQVAEQTGLVYFVKDIALYGDTYGGTVPASSLETYREALNNAYYTSYSSFGGLTVIDEPDADDFVGLARIKQVLKEKFPNKLFHTTLFPFGVEIPRLYLDKDYGSEWDNYSEYVKQYVSIVQPDILVYDMYISARPDDSLENLYSALTRYLPTLSLYRQLSLQNNIPFWTTTNSYNHFTHELYSKKYLEWNVNLSLAYGAKGLQYYTYWEILNERTGPTSWGTHNRFGLVTKNGNPHDTYYNIKAINENIQAVDEVLMKSTSVGLLQFGNQLLPINSSDYCYGYGLLSQITGGDTVVGCFDHDGKTVYYIVNNSITAGRQTFKIDFLKKVNVRLTNSEGVSEVQDTLSVGVNLSAGQAVLLEVL